MGDGNVTACPCGWKLPRKVEVDLESDGGELPAVRAIAFECPECGRDASSRGVAQEEPVAPAGAN